MFRRDVSSCGRLLPSEATPALVRWTAPAGPADGPRARYGVQGSNCCFAYLTPLLTGTHASVGRIGGENHVTTNQRQATGASIEAAMVFEGNDLEGCRLHAMARQEGHRPFRMMRTLSSELRLQ